MRAWLDGFNSDALPASTQGTFSFSYYILSFLFYIALLSLFFHLTACSSGEMKQRVDGLESRLDAQNSMVGALRDDLELVSARIEKMEGSIAKIRAQREKEVYKNPGVSMLVPGAVAVSVEDKDPDDVWAEYLKAAEGFKGEGGRGAIGAADVFAATYPTSWLASRMRHQVAREMYRMQQVEDAEKMFTVFLEETPQSDLVISTAFHLWIIAKQQNRIEDTSKWSSFVRDRFPGSKEAGFIRAAGK